MPIESEPAFTLQELVELNELELKARGETEHDIARSLRARLNNLRVGRGNAEVIERRQTGSVETRLAAVERDVKRLRELMENWQKNG
jgi:hypothetical protein